MTDDVGLVLKCDENGDYFSCPTNGCIKCMVQKMIGIRKDFVFLSSKKSSKERLIPLPCFVKKIIGTSEKDSKYEFPQNVPAKKRMELLVGKPSLSKLAYQALKQCLYQFVKFPRYDTIVSH